MGESVYRERREFTSGEIICFSVKNMPVFCMTISLLLLSELVSVVVYSMSWLNKHNKTYDLCTGSVRKRKGCI